MPKTKLVFSGHTTIDVVIDIHGHPIRERVLLDTGFSSSSGLGLKIPSDYAQNAFYLVTTTVRLANGQVVAVRYIPDGAIIEINGQRTNFPLPTMFMDGPKVVGCMLLQMCKLRLDGPKNEGELEF